MDHFHYQTGALHAEHLPLHDIAEQVGTPCYVYSRATLERHWHAFDRAFGDHPHRICYSVKANGNLAVLGVLARLGSGFDIVSGGELRRVIRAGGDPAHTIFSGVGKQAWEIGEALDAGVGCFNLESEDELDLISQLAAARGTIAAVSVRINPDVDPNTHPYISTGLRENKFGISTDRALAVYQRAARDRHLRVDGVACHIGSQLTDLAPYLHALRRVIGFIGQLRAVGIDIKHLDFGGGLGVRYDTETPPSPAEYAAAITGELARHPDHRRLPVTVEPGRAIAANAGILLTQITRIKTTEARNFCIVDAGMNDLIRPALYDAHQQIIPVQQRPTLPTLPYDIVGPVCESSDFLGKNRPLQIQPADLLAIRTAGAYANVMASNYNTRPRPAEVMVDGGRFHVIKKRETLESLYADEITLPV